VVGADGGGAVRVYVLTRSHEGCHSPGGGSAIGFTEADTASNQPEELYERGIASQVSFIGSKSSVKSDERELDPLI
jgi:hypothetical protein